MKTHQNLTGQARLDEYGEGPWLEEPDHAEWTAHGFTCIVHRGPVGALCGYVGVPPGHPWHGKGYDDVEARVHGSLTYADACQGEICHVPAPGEPEHLWWLGFDCSHGGRDLSPCVDKALRSYRPRTSTIADQILGAGTYRTIDYLKAETERLAAQAAEAAKVST